MEWNLIYLSTLHMTKETDNIIFISWSRSINKLDPLDEEFINKCINKNIKIIIWDADWIDYLAQKYLFNKWYSNVNIYTVNKTPRNNVGNFHTILCDIPYWTFSKAVFGIKDEEMRKICNDGYVIWDWESKGAENNIKNLLKKGKIVTISIHGISLIWSPQEVFSKQKLKEKISLEKQSSIFD